MCNVEHICALIHFCCSARVRMGFQTPLGTVDRVAFYEPLVVIA